MSSSSCLGVNYGGIYESTSPLDIGRAVSIMRELGITRVKIFQPSPELHRALSGPDLRIMTCVPNGDVERLSRNPEEALNFVKEKILPFPSTNFIAIAVGNELLDDIHGGRYNSFLVKSMENVYSALRTLGLQDKIKVVSPQPNGIVRNSYPPSATEFKPELRGVMQDMLGFLKRTGSYFLFNNYGYFTSPNDDKSMRFVLFKENEVRFVDQGLGYTNMFDSQFDGLLWAMEKLGVRDLEVVIGEAGWPTSGSNIANVDNAAVYNNNLIEKVSGGRGTPKRPNVQITTYLFEMFDEDLKPNQNPVERFWGVRTMQGQPKYPISFAKPNPNLPFRDGQYALKSMHGKFIQAVPNNESAKADGRAIDAWERLYIRNTSQANCVEIKQTYGALLYLCAEPSGSLSFSRQSADAWERFQFEIHNSQGKEFVCFKTAHGKFISAKEDGRLLADVTEAQGWEKFELIHL